MNDLRLDLKVCEGCGALWLRGSLTDGVYCRRCAIRLADFPAPRPGRCRNNRPRTCRGGAVPTAVTSTDNTLTTAASTPAYTTVEEGAR